MSLGLTDRLLAHIEQSGRAPLPPTTVRSVKTFLLDSLGVALAGTRVPQLTAVRAVAEHWGRGSAARIWGFGERVPLPTAAGLNAYLIHNQEWDCVHEPAVVHPMAVIVATLLAWCEAHAPVDGERLMRACSTAVDVATTLGCAARGRVRFFRPAICGALGAVAGLAQLARCDRTETRSALGCCYSFVCGTMQAHIEGSPVLPMQIGWNARSALDALALAQQGIVGPGDFLEGQHGFFALYEPDWDPAPFANLGLRAQITELSHKPYPSGRATHGGVDGVLTLQREHGFKPEHIAAIRVFAPPLVRQLVDRPARPQMAPAYARLCAPYVIATALLTGTVGVDDFAPPQLAAPERLALAARVQLLPDGNPAPNALAPQRVEVRLRDGRELAIDLP
ncbi:MAG: MmgE/PrpD family protein, partial [Steroidobacteraceae bacterium]|nr:MmgE/PrpD family protein [Steroidobacteraceae bacterium]